MIWVLKLDERKWKWSNGVGESEMSVIWCIYITNNVISCKKIKETAQMANFTDFPLIFVKVVQNGPKLCKCRCVLFYWRRKKTRNNVRHKIVIFRFTHRTVTARVTEKTLTMAPTRQFSSRWLFTPNFIFQECYQDQSLTWDEIS